MLYYFWLGGDKEYLAYLEDEEFWDAYIGNIEDDPIWKEVDEDDTYAHIQVVDYTNKDN